jgi:hypothetical protein
MAAAWRVRGGVVMEGCREERGEVEGARENVWMAPTQRGCLVW